MTTLCLHALEFSSRAAYYVRVTGRLGRVILALTAFLALPGSLLGSDLVSAAIGHRSVSSASVQARFSMSGMAMHGVGSGPAENASRPLASDVSASSVETRLGAEAERPCEPGSMPSGCAAMGVCAVFTQAALTLPEWTEDPHVGDFAVAAGPASAVQSPELPPPRWSWSTSCNRSAVLAHTSVLASHS